MLAGEDAEAVKLLSRYKAPTEFLKGHKELQAKLSSRPSVMVEPPANATPEQIAEFRKAAGVPEAGTMEAYGIKPPEGYEINETEKGFLSDFAAEMARANVPAKFVQKATEHYFKAQAAQLQAARQFDAQRHKEWDAQLRQEYGSQRDAIVAAGEAYLKQAVAPEALEEILYARLPKGGLTGNHPQFIKFVTELAMAAGYTDRIEAQSLESGGKSIATQRAEIEALQYTNPALYNAPETQKRLERYIALQLQGGDIDEMGNPIRRRVA
jgi:hypothetical protein